MAESFNYCCTNTSDEQDRLVRLRAIFGLEHTSDTSFPAFLPFSYEDTTCGAENELQTVVIGSKHNVDLPLTIEHSNFYKNIIKRTISGETPAQLINAIQDYLDNNPGNVWEHSWVRFPLATLSPYALGVLHYDLRADKKAVLTSIRSDIDRFLFYNNGEQYIRIPVSYLLKLALADVIGSSPTIHPLLKTTAEDLLKHFLNDNTSPETFSFYTVTLRNANVTSIADETLYRFLLTQLLTQYANRRFQLNERGQHVLVYFAPHPPIRQKYLNSLVSDSFYRELFMSPCLSGWDRGEEKYHYMILCHQTLSRSHLNTLAKLKEAGIITRNLIVLPNISNISLANNGTHISIGSRRLSAMLASGHCGISHTDEKYLGDLVIKIVEHFLPLFVGTYSASPYRIDYCDFHPEQVLGFLPHELDYTHLRMIWRRWKKKAAIKIFGKPLTPFGFKTIDTLLSTVFRLRGDFIRDFRLIDYLVALLSTDQSPALDGTLDSDIRLKKDLAELGVFDTKMSLYLLFKQRRFATMGFSGFEARYYSLFENIGTDMEYAALLQTLITALAFKYIMSGEVMHCHIPDTPTIESERRQIFFGAAIGIPTFFVRRDSSNQFLMKILASVDNIRPSHRYPGYLRIYNREYCAGLLKILKRDAADLIELLGLENVIYDLEQRLHHQELTAASRITDGILRETGAKTPLSLSAGEFNSAAERYYRDTLRQKHIAEAIASLQKTITSALSSAHPAGDIMRSFCSDTVPSRIATHIFSPLSDDPSHEGTLLTAIQIVLACIAYNRSMHETSSYYETVPYEPAAASIH
ncbi:MAG: hypothetical protein N3B18_11580 [Desulfobacterota bacterium]|nr:hypothetical protein [Thermodesulfobacteriota bacterium]